MLRRLKIVLVLALLGTASAAAQEVTTDSEYCRKGSADIGKTCVRYYPDKFVDFDWEEDQSFRYVQKRTLDRKTGKETVLWGTTDPSCGRTYNKPQCENFMPIVKAGIAICPKGKDLEFLHAWNGGTWRKFTGVLPIEDSGWEYEDGFKLAVPVNNGIVVRQDGKYALFVYNTERPADSAVIEFPKLTFLSFFNSQAAAVPTGLTVKPGPGLDPMEVVIPVGTDGKTFTPPDPRIKRVIDIFPGDDDALIVTVIEGEDGSLRYVGGSSLYSTATAAVLSRPSYSLIAMDAEQDEEGTWSADYFARGEDGRWINMTTSDFTPEPGIPSGATIDEAYANEIRAEAEKERLAALEREVADKAQAEADAIELAKDQEQYANVKLCFSALVHAYRQGRWNEIDRSNRLWMLQSEGWHHQYGWRAHGDAGDCVDYYQPGQPDFSLDEYSLIQYAPEADVRAAYDEEEDVKAKQSMLAIWARSDTFPADVAARAKGRHRHNHEEERRDV